LFESEEIVLGKSVGFGDDGNEINAGTKALHDFNVQRFQSKVKKNTNMEIKKKGNRGNSIKLALTCVRWDE